jgi:hypothetical protein
MGSSGPLPVREDCRPDRRQSDDALADSRHFDFDASADGACFGQKVRPVWGSSIYVKDGDTWKWKSGINLPARLEGG